MNSVWLSGSRHFCSNAASYAQTWANPADDVPLHRRAVEGECLRPSFRRPSLPWRMFATPGRSTPISSSQRQQRGLSASLNCRCAEPSVTPVAQLLETLHGTECFYTLKRDFLPTSRQARQDPARSARHTRTSTSRSIWKNSRPGNNTLASQRARQRAGLFYCLTSEFITCILAF